MLDSVIRTIITVTLILSSTWGQRVEVPVYEKGAYSVIVNNQVWFHSADTSIHHMGRDYSSTDGSLQILKSNTQLGQDILGSYTKVLLEWQVPSGPKFETSIRTYKDIPSAVLFEQYFPDGASKTATDPQGTMSSFPTLKPSWTQAKGVTIWADSKGPAPWPGKTPPVEGTLSGGIGGTGPLIVFNEDLSESVVISAFTNIMAHAQTFCDNTLRYGVIGSATFVPPGFRVTTILNVGKGISSAMESWGDVLLKWHKKERYGYKRDLANQYLGYSTDNGAFYYYHTEAGKNYEATIIDIQADAEHRGLPYKYVLLDSWWYYQGENGGGVVTWDARPDIFPDGLLGLQSKTHWPHQLHNKYWDAETTYAKQNGGRFQFICDGDTICLPVEQAFWNELFANKSKSGMFMYEQDWQWIQFNRTKELHEDPTLGHTWMMQMNTAAAMHNVTMQLCMTYSRQQLQSVEMGQVTNMRASGDYQPGNGDWDTAKTAIYYHAIGAAPSKDNYWSAAYQPGNPRYGNATEPHSRLHSAAASLTTGPVAVSDKIGSANASIILRACDAAGRLLTPDRPATYVDEMFLQKAFSKGGPNGHVWSTYASVGATYFQYLLGIDLLSPYSHRLDTFNHSASRLIATEMDSETAQEVSARGSFNFPKCGEDDFKLILLSPIVHGYALLGEPNKWVSVSAQRFSELHFSEGEASVTIHGQAGESVTVRWWVMQKVVVSPCIVPASGWMGASIRGEAASCTSAFYNIFT